jgi:hypothetical protein
MRLPFCARRAPVLVLITDIVDSFPAQIPGSPTPSETCHEPNNGRSTNRFNALLSVGFSTRAAAAARQPFDGGLCLRGASRGAGSI